MKFNSKWFWPCNIYQNCTQIWEGVVYRGPKVVGAMISGVWGYAVNGGRVFCRSGDEDIVKPAQFYQCRKPNTAIYFYRLCELNNFKQIFLF